MVLYEGKIVGRPPPPPQYLSTPLFSAFIYINLLKLNRKRQLEQDNYSPNF